jgi:recombinational DNA repair ATPase RecF
VDGATNQSTVDDWLARFPEAVDVDEVSAAEGRAQAEEQAVRDDASRLVAVADAEEARDAARAEAVRLRELDAVLTHTRRHLVQAQDDLYQAIAPDLVAAVRRDLAAVTLGRYTDVAVHPGSLAVQVRSGNGPLRDANQLSVGAAEQVYLLLRVALAAWRVKEGETCPLLLDDVTVHADEQRKEQMLSVLLTVAEHRQVVLFTQEEQVRQWARAHLDGTRHVLRELQTVPSD